MARIERRRYCSKDTSAPEWDGYAALHGLQQAIRIERERRQVRAGETSIEVTYALTSLGSAQATPLQLAATDPQPLADREPSALRARLHPGRFNVRRASPTSLWRTTGLQPRTKSVAVLSAFGSHF